MDAWLLFFSTCLPKSQESNRRVPLGGTNTQRLHWRRRGWAWGRSLLSSRSSGLPPEAAPVVVVLCYLGSGCTVVRPACRGEVTQRSCDGQVELRPWRRDGHPQVGDSAETAAGGGPEPACGEGPLAVEFGLEARVLVRGWVLG